MNVDFMESQEDLGMTGKKLLQEIHYVQLKKKYQSENIKEVNRVTPTGPTPNWATEKSKAILRFNPDKASQRKKSKKANGLH